MSIVKAAGAPDGFTRLQLVVLLGNATNEPAEAGLRVTSGVAATLVGALARSDAGFVYGLGGADTPAAGMTSGSPAGSEGRAAGLIPPGVQVPLNLAVDVPTDVTGFQIGLVMLSQTEQGGTSATTTCSPGPCEMDLPVSAFASTSAAPTLVVTNNSIVKGRGETLVQGPLSVTPIAVSVLRPFNTGISMSPWRADVQLKASNSYGYALWNSGAWAEVLDSRGCIWDAQPPIVTNFDPHIWPNANELAPDSIPPGASERLDVEVMLYSPGMYAGDQNVTQCTGQPGTGHMYLFLFMPQLIDQDAQPLADATWGFFDLGAPAQK